MYDNILDSLAINKPKPIITAIKKTAVGRHLDVFGGNISFLGFNMVGLWFCEKYDLDTNRSIKLYGLKLIINIYSKTINANLNLHYFLITDIYHIKILKKRRKSFIFLKYLLTDTICNYPLSTAPYSLQGVNMV